MAEAACPNHAELAHRSHPLPPLPVIVVFCFLNGLPLDSVFGGNLFLLLSVCLEAVVCQLGQSLAWAWALDSSPLWAGVVPQVMGEDPVRAER